MNSAFARFACAAMVFGLISPRIAHALNPDEVRAIAKDAYIYGYPLVDSYRINYSYALDKENPEYKGPMNTISSFSRVFTPADTTVQTPNSDTPYSFVIYDLRTEPYVISVPPIEANRYFSIQLIDAYTHNFAYIGSRTTGNNGGRYLLAGPGWQGEKPDGIDEVIRSETDLCMTLYRTQLFNPSDIENVKAIQARYSVEPLSSFLGQPAPEPAPAVDFIQPLTPDTQKTSLEFFNVLSFVLNFCPTVESETDTMARFAAIGVGAGRSIDVATLDADVQQAMHAGVADAWAELKALEEGDIAAGKVTSGDLFGDRARLNGNYLYRFAAAILGIYGNSKEEAMYPAYRVDSGGKHLDGSLSNYSVRFAPGQLPPVKAFWSLTMYKLPESLLSENAINRFLINSPMLPDLKRDEDGGITLYIQQDSPGADKESNWLPAPNGPFWCALRLYWPEDVALKGGWKQPPMNAVAR